MNASVRESFPESSVSVDADGQLHLKALTAEVIDPEVLAQRDAVVARLPRVPGRGVQRFALACRSRPEVLGTGQVAWIGAVCRAPGYRPGRLRGSPGC
jgi:hypothetical protein